MSLFTAVAARASSLVIPAWAPWVAGGFALVAALGGSYGLGRVQEARIGAAALSDYKAAELKKTVKVVEAEVKVVTKIETVYRDRVQKVYAEGEKIVTHTKEYVQPVDDARFGVNVGFLRNTDAAWAGTPAGPASSADREPSPLPLSAVASLEAGNITSCRAWREQAIGWRQFYAEQQTAVNGAPGAWYKDSGAKDMLDNTPITVLDEGTIGAAK